MKKLAIVYWSGTGNTEAMAEAIKEGAGGESKLFTADSFNSSMLADYDVIAFGCPSMGDEELEDSEFLPMWEEVSTKLADKPIALFGSYGWGDGEWMRLWEAEAKSQGLNLVHEPLIVNETPEDDAIADCQAFGAAIVQ